MALTKVSEGGVKDDAASQAKIADEAVDEARLQISNAGTNGQFLSKQSGNTGGLTWADAITAIADDSITQAKIADDAIGQDQLAQNAVVADNLTADCVTSVKIADGAVTEYRIGDNEVTEPKLKISNAGTNGQFLSKQSGNTGGLTWATVDAAPTITATASGAIAANDPVIINSDGTVSKPAVVASAFGSKQKWRDSEVTYTDVCYEPVNNKVVVTWRDAVDWNRVSCMAGTVDGSNKTITWGSILHCSTTTGNSANYGVVPAIAATNYLGWCVVVWHSSYSNNNVKATAVQTSSSNNNLTKNNQDNAYGKTIELTGTYTSTEGRALDIAWDTNNGGSNGGIAINCNTSENVTAKHLQINSSGELGIAGSEKQLASGNGIKSSVIAFNPDTSTYIAAWNAFDNNRVEARVIYKDGNNVGLNTAITDVTGALGDGFVQAISYAAVYKKFLIGWAIYSGGSSGNDLMATLVDTNSITTGGGATQTLAAGTNLVVDDVTENKGRGDLVFNDDKECWLYVWRGKHGSLGNDGVYNIIKYDGSSLSKGTTAATNGINDALYPSACYDPDTKNFLYAFRDGESANNQDGQVIVLSPAYDTLKTKNFIGFAQAGYSNGATAKISVVGNQSTQSSLTPASTYYVQTNGTLSTTADSPSVEAGVALSSTKLLIKAF